MFENDYIIINKDIKFNKKNTNFKKNKFDKKCKIIYNKEKNGETLCMIL